MDDRYDSVDDIGDDVDGRRYRKNPKPRRICVSPNTSVVDNGQEILRPASSLPSLADTKRNETTVKINSPRTPSPSVVKHEAETKKKPANNSLPSYCYRVDYPRRGVCAIISNDEFHPSTKMQSRLGAMMDLGSIVASFETLGFECKLSVNYTVAQARERIKQLASEDHSDADCFACVILTHGLTNGDLYMYDGLIKLDEVITPFKGNNCPTLLGKPKMFFVQACRGTQFDSGVVFTEDFTDSGNVGLPSHSQRIPVEADILVAHSVPEGYYSWRNSKDGSWFIQALSRYLRSDGYHLDLLTLLTRVSSSVATEFESRASVPSMSMKKQVPCIQSMLTKQLFFLPK